MARSKSFDFDLDKGNVAILRVIVSRFEHDKACIRLGAAKGYRRPIRPPWLSEDGTTDAKFLEYIKAEHIEAANTKYAEEKKRWDEWCILFNSGFSDRNRHNKT